MTTTSKLFVSAFLAAGAALGLGASASAAPSPEVLCESVGGGEIPVGAGFVHWGCDLADAKPGGKERMMRVAYNTGACKQDKFVEFDLDLPAMYGGRMLLVICVEV